MQACHALLLEADSGSHPGAVAALNQLCNLLEAAESQYQELIGDPQLNPAQRTHYPIGQLLCAVNREEAACARIHEHWTFRAQVCAQDGQSCIMIQSRLACGRPVSLAVTCSVCELGSPL